MVYKEDGKLLSRINPVHLDNLGEIDSTSIYIHDNDYRILTLRFLELEDKKLEYNSLSHLFIKDEIYSVSSSHEHLKLNGNSTELYTLIDSKVSYQSNLISVFVKEVEVLEDKIFERKELSRFLTEWFHYKKGLLKLSRVFERLSTVMSNFIKKEQELINDNSKEFSDLLYDIEVQQRLIKSELEKLDTVYTYYTSIKNDNLNRNIYGLSVISGIFLPLNLIVGFFGMNTSGLFLSNQPEATTYVFKIILVLFFLLLVGMPALTIFNRIIASRLFGRYNFYSKLSNKFEKISRDFSILDNK